MAQNGLFPVSVTRHKNRYWRRYDTYGFARHKTECDLVVTELLPAAAAFPICFRRKAQTIMPYALLTVNAETETPFVSEAGNWMAAYVPSALRCYPFLAEARFGHDEPHRPTRLFVDENSGLVTTDQRDQPFFSPGGQLTPELGNILHFFQARQRALSKTQYLCALADKMGLFTEIAQCSSFSLPEGLLGIDSSKLDQLPQAQIAVLFKSGLMQLIYAHQISLGHCEWLACVQTRLSGVTRNMPVQEGLNGFLSALTAEVGTPQSDWEVARAS